MPETGLPQYTHMKADEITLASRWYLEGKTLVQISQLLERDVKTIRKMLSSRRIPQGS